MSLSANPTAPGIPRLKASAVRFGILPEPQSQPNTAQIPKFVNVLTPLKTTMTLLDDEQTRICVICLDWTAVPLHVTRHWSRKLSAELHIPPEQVLFFNSHNHSDIPLIAGPPRFLEWGMPPYEEAEVHLNGVGEELERQLLENAHRLADELQPVHVYWGTAQEDRITYNRKGRRPDGTTFFMREEDRLLEGEDFRGDIDTQAPIVVFRNLHGDAVAAWIQFTGHPVTSYHPENPVVHGDYPQISCDFVGRHLGAHSDVPVGFFQGCCGDVNAKGMFRGGAEMATQLGEMIGQSYVDAIPGLTLSVQDGMDFVELKADIPLSGLPSEEVLQKELEEIEDFIERARSGDPDTLTCAGLNFPRDLSPAYRGGLVERIRHWTVWALAQWQSKTAEQLPRVFPMPFWALRVGDVGIVAMPCEPFQEVGREIRKHSPFPLTIPCAYANYVTGYMPDETSIGDREYMSSFHRYSALPDQSIRPRPPFAKPGGNVIAQTAVQYFRELNNR